MSQGIGSERDEAGISKSRIDIVLNDIEREVVRTAEGPDGDDQEQRIPQARPFKQQQASGHDAQNDEKRRLGVQHS